MAGDIAQNRCHCDRGQQNITFPPWCARWLLCHCCSCPSFFYFRTSLLRAAWHPVRVSPWGAGAVRGERCGGRPDSCEEPRAAAPASQRPAACAGSWRPPRGAQRRKGLAPPRGDDGARRPGPPLLGHGGTVARAAIELRKCCGPRAASGSGRSVPSRCEEAAG